MNSFAVERFRISRYPAACSGFCKDKQDLGIRIKYSRRAIFQKISTGTGNFIKSLIISGISR